ncbi:MAG: hypothetical protein ACIARQ_05695 [Phycisphaerales bacterium JB061]
MRIVKAALTAEHVRKLDLHDGQLFKETSSRYRRFVEAHGDWAWELESLTADQLREIVETAIRGVLTPTLIRAAPHSGHRPSPTDESS